MTYFSETSVWSSSGGEKGTGVSNDQSTTGVVSKNQKHSSNILD